MHTAQYSCFITFAWTIADGKGLNILLCRFLQVLGITVSFCFGSEYFQNKTRVQFGSIFRTGIFLKSWFWFVVILFHLLQQSKNCQTKMLHNDMAYCISKKNSLGHSINGSAILCSGRKAPCMRKCWTLVSSSLTVSIARQSNVIWFEEKQHTIMVVSH